MEHAPPPRMMHTEVKLYIGTTCTYMYFLSSQRENSQ